jgi:hypothetical protein
VRSGNGGFPVSHHEKAGAAKKAVPAKKTAAKKTTKK